MDMAKSIKQAGKKITKAFARTEDSQTTDILDTLKKEHDEVQDLLGQLVGSESAASRKSLLKQIKAALVPHVRAEEKVVYDSVLSLKDKEAKQNGEEGYLEHRHADMALATLGKIKNAMSPEFSAAAKVLKELVEHHVQEEERNVWAEVKENFSDEERAAMNRQFEAAKKKVRLPN
jgi:hemerythrin superfamily protein